MLHDFVLQNRDILIQRCRQRAAERNGPLMREYKFEYGIPLFIDQLIKTLRLEEDGNARTAQSVSGSADDSVRGSEKSAGRPRISSIVTSTQQPRTRNGSQTSQSFRSRRARSNYRPSSTASMAWSSAGPLGRIPTLSSSTRCSMRPSRQQPEAMSGPSSTLIGEHTIAGLAGYRGSWK